MNADEVVRIDEAVKALHRLSVFLVTPDSIVCCEAADLIESLQAKHKQAALNYQQKCRDVVELEAQLAESQRREKADAELIRKIYFATDEDLCDCCRKIVRMIEAWWNDDEKGEAE